MGYTKTQQKLAEMLIENVPHNLLDSGGAYGYAHEKNRGRVFRGEDEGQLEIWYLDEPDKRPDILYTKSLFHYLDRWCYYEKELTEEMLKFMEDGSREEDWLESLIEKDKPVTGLYGNGDYLQGYTYNEENNLDQNYLYVYYEYDGDPYIIIRIHGGCDARSGFSKPAVFSCETEMLGDLCSGTIYCSNCNKVWDCYSPCSGWEEVNGEFDNLEDCQLESYKDEVRVALCPACKEGKLEP